MANPNKIRFYISVLYFWFIFIVIEDRDVQPIILIFEGQLREWVERRVQGLGLDKCGEGTKKEDQEIITGTFVQRELSACQVQQGSGVQEHTILQEEIGEWGIRNRCVIQREI